LMAASESSESTGEELSSGAGIESGALAKPVAAPSSERVES